MGRATQYIGSKLNHESDKKVNHGEERKTVNKLNHGAGREKSTASPQNVCGDLSSFGPCIGVGIRFAGQNHNFEAIRRDSTVFSVFVTFLRRDDKRRVLRNCAHVDRMANFKSDVLES
jgi:hypothetical protein